MNQLARTKQTKAAMPLVKYGPLPGSLGRPRRYSWWDEAPRLLHLALLNQVPKPHHPLHHHHHHPLFPPCKYLLGKTLVIPPSVATNLAKTPALTGREDEAVDQSGCNRSRGRKWWNCAATMVRILQLSAFSGFVFAFLSLFYLPYRLALFGRREKNKEETARRETTKPK